MAELNTNPGKSGNRVRTKKAALRVDLTAMVDLAFLLITFFMLTTTLSKPKAMDVVMPVGESGAVPQSRTMTICLGNNNKALWYLGEPQNPKIPATITDYGKSGLRRAITEVRDEVRKTTGKDLIVVIKPAETSVYENLVNTLDEMNINNIQQFAIANIDKTDIDLLKQKQAF